MTPDLDALAALLAAATPPWSYYEWHVYVGAGMSKRDVAQTFDETTSHLIVTAVNALPSLIEAARREAGLREALTLTLDAYDEVMATDLSGISHLEAVSARATLGRTLGEKVRSLLHDNAGTATGDGT